PDPRQHPLQIGLPHMQQTCARPYRVILIVFVELIETQGLDWPAEPACGFCRHFRRAVGRSNVEARRDHLGRMHPRTAAELQDLGVTRQGDEEGVQARQRALRPFDIFSRVLPIETDRGVVEALRSAPCNAQALVERWIAQARTLLMCRMPVSQYERK